MGKFKLAFRQTGASQSSLSASAVSQVPSDQNNQYAKLAYFEVASSDPLHYQNQKTDISTIHRAYSNFTRYMIAYMCVQLYAVLSHVQTYIVRVCAMSLQLCLTLPSYGLQPTRHLCPWDSPGKNVGVGCHALLQGIFLIQGSNPR